MAVHDVFISYAREDRSAARRLATAFAAAPRGWLVWWDTELRTGGRFGQEIEEHLKNCRCVVVLWSPHSVGSDWVAAEAEIGRERGVLVPVRIAECEPPMPFGQIQTADLAGWRGAESAPEWGKVLDAIQVAMARGVEVDEAEREARRIRMEQVRKSRRRNRAALALAVLLIVALGWWGVGGLSARRDAGRIAALSREIRVELLNPESDEQQNKKWWWLLSDYPDNLAALEQSVLLGVEAVRRADIQESRETLRDAITLLPWSNVVQEIAPDNMPSAMVFSRDGRLIAAGGGRGDTLVWDVEEDRILARIPHGKSGGAEWERERHRSAAGRRVVAFSPNARHLATAAPDETVRLWSIESGEEVRRFQHSGITSSVAFSPDGEILAATDEVGEIRFWNPDSGELVRTLEHDKVSRALFFSPSGRLLGTVGRDHKARIWNVENGARIAEWTHEPDHWTGYLVGLSFSPDEQSVVVYGSSVPTTLWDIESGEAVWDMGPREVGGMVFSRDGKTLVVGGAESISWLDVESRQPIRVIPTSYIADLWVDAERRVLTGATFDGGLAQAWDFDSGRELRRLPYAKWPSAVGADPKGKWLASAGNDWGSGKNLLEATRLQPDDLVGAGCRGVGRNFTQDEWLEFFPGEQYRLTCPEFPEPEAE